MTLQIFDLDPDSYRPHRMHSEASNWTEANCWQDMMVEVLHSLDLDPVAGCAFTLSTDFEGGYWTLFKFPPEDLRALYGLEVEELYVWRPVVDHLEENLALGHLVTVEVDAWYLPDTAGVTYRTDHVKTGIVPQMLDRAGRRLGYFHNAGYFELRTEDFDGIFFLDSRRDPRVLLPYMEVIKLGHLQHLEEGRLVETALDLTRRHLQRRPTSNPIARFKKRLQSDLAWLADQGEAAFHSYAFATCRQCGANAETAAAFVEWLDLHDGGGLSGTAGELNAIAESAKGLQFALARVARGRKVDLEAPFAEMERAWESVMEALVDRYDR